MVYAVEMRLSVCTIIKQVVLNSSLKTVCFLTPTFFVEILVWSSPVGVRNMHGVGRICHTETSALSGK